ARYGVQARDLFRRAGDHAGEAQALRLATTLFDHAGATGDAIEARYTTARVQQDRGDYAAARAAAADALARPQAAELLRYHSVIDAQATVQALLDTRTAADRVRVSAAEPALRGDLALQVLIDQRDEVYGQPAGSEPALRGRLDAALDYLDRLPGGALSRQFATEWDQGRRVAGPGADRLSPDLTAAVRRLLHTDLPTRPIELL